MKSLPESQVAVPLLLAVPTALDVTDLAARPRAVPAPALRLLSDERLARLSSAGDRAAFGVIFHRYHHELYRFCVSILRNVVDAEDALQSTMLRALNALESDTREFALRPWLYRIAHNESITLLRRRRHAEVNAEVSLPARLDVEASAELNAELQELLDDLRELPERQRAAIVMRELGGLGYSEIGAVLETTAAGAKQATYDARRALHELAMGREMDCAVVCTTVLGGDGRALRRRALRAHLRACGDCRDYRSAIAERQSRVAALAPAMPSAAAMRLLDSVFASAGGGFGGAGLFTGFGVPAALKSLTALALVAASTAGVLQVVEPGTGRGPAGEERAAPVVAPSGPAAPARSTHRARSSARAHGGHGTAPRGRADAERARAPYADAAPPRESSVVTHGSPVAGPAVTPDAAPSGREAPPRHHGGRVRNLVSGTADSDPVQHAVSVITHPNVPSAPEVRVTLPVKVPTAPPHPKRKHAKHLA